MALEFPNDWDTVRTIVREMIMRGELDERIRKVAGGGAPPSVPPPAQYETGRYDAGTYG